MPWAITVIFLDLVPAEGKPLFRACPELWPHMKDAGAMYWPASLSLSSLVGSHQLPTGNFPS